MYYIMKKQITESEKKQRERYQVNIKLNPVKDKDIIEKLEAAEKKQTYIKRCIQLAE